MDRDLKELKTLLLAIKRVRQEWQQKKTQDAFMRLMSLYSCLGEDINKYERCIKNI